MFSTFNIMPIGVAWKESTANGPRPPSPSSHRGAAIAGCVITGGYLLRTVLIYLFEATPAVTAADSFSGLDGFLNSAEHAACLSVCPGA